MCQHKYLSELGQESLYNNILKFIINNVIFKFNKRKRAIFKNVRNRFAKNKNNCIANINFENFIKPGDIVRVNSKEDIIDILDYNGRYKRCQFMDEMYDHCNKQYKVYKEVGYFYDAGINKVCKCNDLFILEGLNCRGRKGVPMEICNLNCYFFWHKVWLAK